VASISAMALSTCGRIGVRRRAREGVHVHLDQGGILIRVAS
jgi:hypothetical protein